MKLTESAAWVAGLLSGLLSREERVVITGATTSTPGDTEATFDVEIPDRLGPGRTAYTIVVRRRSPAADERRHR